MREHGIGLSQAFRTMTIIPVRGKDAKNASTQLCFYPVVGFVLGAMFSTVLWFCLGDGTLTTLKALLLGGLWTAYMAFMTRGFHLDGLGDMADAFGGGWTKERRLEIMKDSRMGSFGTITIAMTLLMKTVSGALVISGRAFALLAIAPVVSRAMVVLMCSTCFYAKESGLSFDLVNGAKARHSLVAFAICIIFYALAVFLSANGFGAPMTPISTFVPPLASLAATAVVGIMSNSKISGITGDILGACCEVTETVFLVSCCFWCMR